MKNRPERLICFVVVWLTMFSCNDVRGQVVLRKGSKMDFLHLQYPGAKNGQYGLTGPYFLSKTGEPADISPDFSMNAYSAGDRARTDGLYNQPPNLYYIQSGFFCKREWELEKATHIPFRFRLGSLADCDALEGKH
jgi:hypothetical protein